MARLQQLEKEKCVFWREETFAININKITHNATRGTQREREREKGNLVTHKS